MLNEKDLLEYNQKNAEIVNAYAQLSSSNTHKLAYYVIGLETVIAGYILINKSYFVQVPFIHCLFLIDALSILAGLVWLQFYNIHQHLTAVYHAALIKLETAQITELLIKNPLENFDLATQSKELKQAEQELQKYKGCRYKFQNSFYYCFTSFSYIAFILLTILGFIFLIK